MEFIIFVKHRWADFNGNWMDRPGKYTERKNALLARIPPEKHAEFLVKFDREFDAKIIEGDIIEIHEDGWWENVATKGKNSNMPDCFACIQVTGMPVNKIYASQVKDNKENIIRYSRFRILSGYKLGELIKVASINNVDLEDKTQSIQLQA